MLSRRETTAAPMDLHIFNPEHETVMAYGCRHVTVPHAVQELRMSLGWLPALWARDGDMVLVDDAPFAVKAASKARVPKADVLYMEKGGLEGQSFDNIIPWGWDEAVRSMLEGMRLSSPSVPGARRVDDIRLRSSRENNKAAIEAVRTGIESLTCGECERVASFGEAVSAVERWGRAVAKAPWSSSGRGIRYLDAGRLTAEEHWLKNVLRRQGCVVMEPYYNKVRDFAMEFRALDGGVEYCGLSLFHTCNGGYTGNIIAPEEEKMRMLRRYIPDDTIMKARECVMEYAAKQLQGVYSGPFGVDMMVVAGEKGRGFLLHPFVEMNLRRTMGHVALDISDAETGATRVMRIRHNVNYYLKISDLDNNFVQVI